MTTTRSRPVGHAAPFVAGFPAVIRLSGVLALLFAMLSARAADGQVSVLPDASSVGLTRFELQRSLLEIDEQRRKLELSLEPVDSVLRMMASDTAHIAALKRATVVDRDAASVRSLARQLRVAPGSPELTTRFVAAINNATRDFSAADNGLGTRVLVGASAQDFLARSPNAGIVALDAPLPPYDTPLWDKVRQSDYGRGHLASITDDDVKGFQYAVSDTGFETYKAALSGAFARRMAEIRQTRDASRADVQRLRRRASDIAHVIGAADESSIQLDVRLVSVALPVFAVVLVVVLFAPRVYRSPELQAYIFTSGLLLEITALVLVTGTVLALGLGGRIHAEVIGTLLGALTGFVLGRAVPRRQAELFPQSHGTVAYTVQAPYAGQPIFPTMPAPAGYAPANPSAYPPAYGPPAAQPVGPAGGAPAAAAAQSNAPTTAPPPAPTAPPSAPPSQRPGRFR